MRFDPTSLVLITAAVALAPNVTTAVRVVPVPTVVVELILGIAIGPDVLDIAREGPFVTFLAGLDALLSSTTAVVPLPVFLGCFLPAAAIALRRAAREAGVATETPT